MMSRVLKTGIGFLLLPVFAFLAVLLGDLVLVLVRHAAAEGWPKATVGLGLGLCAAGLGFPFLPRPMWGYVRHEITHAVVALLRGARVSRFRVRRDGGSVAVSESGVWVSLSPYIVPPATILVLLLWGAVFLFSERWGGRGHGGWLFAVGVTWGFHIALTASMLARSQSDIEAHGRFFSLSLISVFHLALAIGVLCVAAPVLRSALFPLAETRFLAWIEWVRRLSTVSAWGR